LRPTGDGNLGLADTCQGSDIGQLNPFPRFEKTIALSRFRALAKQAFAFMRAA